MKTGELKPKIAVIIQRYGKSVLGGESLCRHVMEHLQSTMDITVLTTCARDYRTWRNEFTPGEQQEAGVKIIRFPVQQPRAMFLFKWFTRAVYVCQWLYNHGLRAKRSLIALQKLWLCAQGPYCPTLIQYLKQQHDHYDAFIFFTYLYYPTACGIQQVADKAILFPSAHDERPIYLHWYQQVFASAQALIMQTPEESDFVNKFFPVQHKPQRLAAMQITTIDNFSNDPSVSDDAVNQFIQKYQLQSPYILYSGRIELAKGAIWMWQHFLRFIEETQHPVQLVLIGKAYLNIPQHQQIRYLGFLPEHEKRCAILGCQFFLMPSYFESFSVSLLEAFGLGRPALVNAHCAVLRGHIDRSQAGFAVHDYAEFKSACLALLASDPKIYGTNGMRYVQQQYQWDQIVSAYQELIDIVKKQILN